MKTTSQAQPRRVESRVNLVCPPDLVERLRQHQAELEASTGLPVSMSAAAVRLLRRGLDQTNKTATAT